MKIEIKRYGTDEVLHSTDVPNNSTKLVLLDAIRNGICLDEAELSSALLNDINFEGTSLNNANFFGSDLRYSDLRFCDIENANFHNTNMQGAKITIGLREFIIFE